MDKLIEFITQEPVTRFAVSIVCIAIAVFAIALTSIIIINFVQGRGFEIRGIKIPERGQTKSYNARNKSQTLSWEEYWDSVKTLAEQLMGGTRGGGFNPDLIIGISRGGGVVSDLLSRVLNNVPIIVLWARRDFSTDPREVFYAPPVNPYNRQDLPQIVKDGKIMKILVVDDFCKMGASLDCALKFINEKLETLPAEMRNDIVVKTAVIAKEARFDSTRIVKPDYCIHDNKTHLPYGRG
jgi:hypoxanthine phosphoribosyltransferase